MNEKLEFDESTVSKFVNDFFTYYDKNRHILHTLFSEEGTFVVLGNRASGHSAIQQTMLTMASTTHRLLSLDIQILHVPMPENISIYQVLCAGDVEFGGDKQIHGFTAVLLVYFQKPSVLHVMSFNERCKWPKLS